MTKDEIGQMLVENARLAVQTANYNGIGPANASGQLADSIEYRITPEGINVVVVGPAAKYVRTLRHGRGPTLNEGQGALRPAIREWLDVKGVGAPDEREGISYAITKTIHAEGNLVTRRNLAPTNIWDGVITPEVIKQFIEATKNQIVYGNVN